MSEKASQELREDVYKRQKGICGCQMKTCTQHSGKKCDAILRGAWEVHRITAGGDYVPSNVIGLCQTCHRNTPSYGVGKS
jgi:hypothetical protein